VGDAGGGVKRGCLAGMFGVWPTPAPIGAVGLPKGGAFDKRHAKFLLCSGNDTLSIEQMSWPQFDRSL